MRFHKGYKIRIDNMLLLIDPQRGSLVAAATQELKDVQTNREEKLYDKGHDILKSY